MSFPRLYARVCASIFFLNLIIVAASPQVWAESAGVSFYAMPGFSKSQCTAALKVFDGVPTPALTTLWATFGSNYSCLARYLDSAQDRQHILEIHISNQVCLRHSDCGIYELSGVLRLNPTTFTQRIEHRDPYLLGRIQRRIDEVVQWAKANRKPTTRLLISTGLEDNYSDFAYRVILRMLAAGQSVTPFEIVRNPVRPRIGSDELSSADFLESHNVSQNAPRDLEERCIMNNDGSDLSFTGTRITNRSLNLLNAILPRSLSSRCLLFLWWGSVQGFDGREINYAIDPRRRVLAVRTREISAIRNFILMN